MIQLQPDHLKLVREILSRHVPHYEVRAFGSRVAGTVKKYSDLDLVIMSKDPIAPLIIALLRDDFSESNLPFKVDVIDWACTQEGFRKLIENGYEIIQK